MHTSISFPLIGSVFGGLVALAFFTQKRSGSWAIVDDAFNFVFVAGGLLLGFTGGTIVSWFIH